ncbi:unnamed protein product [Rotaria sordida]|uniref:Uncharacterized protein n=1 Tax=Rotaria sordida TaxID=392033 RepID=A0A814KTQ4_9BILA|nr:unnamed protein product [Rotaria sordida]CAF1054086.1 unnamed protein product [Rotaria sordida]CAF3769835.1 unnamed protein product [Rotaria sordida]CAF3947669.1 unnamed protein product [Rotaria sordida]
MAFNQQITRNERERQLNIQLSFLTEITALNDYEIYHINQLISTMVLHDLIALTRKVTRFTMHTEGDYFRHEPALIQIEFIQDKSIILFIKKNYLSDKESVLF